MDFHQSHAEPLIWGTGPKLFEVFLEPTCPFSARAFKKLDPFLEHVGPENVTLRIWLHSQPWHMFSGVITRAILAASATAQGKEAARAVMAAVFADHDAYEFTNHATGPNMHETPEGLLARIAKASGVDFREAFDAPDLEQEIKRHCRYARQNGIHVSPTFLIQGLVDPALGSGDDIETWAARFNAARL